MATPENIERSKTRRKDIADAEALGEGDAVEGFMPVEQSEFESREDYRGYKVPKGMSLPQRRKWKQAIDERENFRSKAARQLPRQVEDYIKEPLKDFGRSAKEVGKGIGEFAVDAALTVPRAKAAMYTDPEGSKEFMGAVASGDREARKQLATGASESMVEPAATMGDAALTKYAAEEGKYGEAALYGASVLLPFVSVGWLKAAMKAGEVPPEAAKKIADLEKRYEAGDVTDEMQVRRELAGIEDAHKAEYMQSKPPGGGRSVDERRDFRRSLYTKEGVDEANLEFRRALYTKKTFPEAMEVVERRFMLNSEPFKRVLASEIAGVEPSIKDLRALNSIEADEIKSRLYSLAGRTDFEAQEFMDRWQSLGGKTPSGGRSIDDIEGPSEAEIDQMVETSKFGDPEELEMLREDMRRMAELEQQGQIKRRDMRRRRTPPAGTARERPKKKE